LSMGVRTTDPAIRCSAPRISSIVGGVIMVADR
jgi:hypothetical protein